MAHSQTAYVNNLGVLGHPIVLRHPAISEQLSIVSRLLCTSKTVAAALCNHAAGLLVLNMTSGPIPTESPKLHWLSRNSSLVKSLILSFMPCYSSAEVQQLAYLCSKYSDILHSLELETSPEDTDTVEQLAAVINENGAKLRTFRITWTEDPDESNLWVQLLADAMQQAPTTEAGFNSKPYPGGMQYTQLPGRLPAAAAAPQQPGGLIAGQRAAGPPESVLDFSRLPNLQSFWTCLEVGAALLKHLPATLTELSFEYVSHISDEDMTQMKAALRRLTNLQSLRFCVDQDPDVVNASSVIAQLPMQSLTSLTMLELDGLQEVGFAAVLPVSLKWLELFTAPNIVASPLVIGHLTQLTRLYFGMIHDEHDPGPSIMPGSALPASLEQLYCFDIAPDVLTGLTNLRKFALSGCTIPGSSFVDVGEALTQLEKVELIYLSSWRVTQEASFTSDILGWSNIPLTRLDLSLGGYLRTVGGWPRQKCAQQQLAAGLSNLGRLQTLTTLLLSGPCYYATAQKPQIDTEVLVRSLCKLSSLCCLSLLHVKLTGGDVALTRLKEAVDSMSTTCRLLMWQVDTGPGAAASGSTKLAV